MRPTLEDKEALEFLLEEPDLPKASALFIEGLHENIEGARWTPKQCAWFDDLCERYIE
jgi:hypothetical protein